MPTFHRATCSRLTSPTHHVWHVKSGLRLPPRYCRQCLLARSISRACAGEAGQRGNAKHKNTAETKSCNCKWPLTNTRPHLLVVFEVCRQRPVPVPPNSSHWSSSEVECRKTKPPAGGCCQEPKPGLWGGWWVS